METIRQIVQVNADRKLEIHLPDTVEPGLVEVVLVLQPMQKPDPAPNPHQKALTALKELAAIRQQLPPVDAVQLIRDGRETLEQRGQI